MLGRSPSKYRPEFTFKPEPEGTRKLEKSHTRTEGIQRTPSAQCINSYYDLEHKPTDKKKANYNIAYQAPVLIEQNKTLLAENREMALLIHERNLQIEALERKYDEKIEGEEQLFRQIEAQKQRFISEVIRHKEQTDLQIEAMEHRIRELEEQKVSLERKWNRERLSDQELTERDRKKQLQKLKSHFQESNTILQAEKLKVKTELQQRMNELHILQMEGKQKVEELQYQVQKAKEEAKHAEHLRKIEKAEIKQYYENKLQKTHLEHRRDKELFLTEHQNQIKKLEEEVSKLKNERLLMEEKMQRKEQDNKAISQQEAEQRERLINEADEARYLAKEQLRLERKTISNILQAQAEATHCMNNQELNSLVLQNRHLSALLIAKSEQIARLYGEIDALRDRYCLELQQNEKVISDLVSKIYTNQLGSEEQKEVLKTKLSVLRQSDLSGLTSYFANQIKVLNDKLAEKERAILENRSKLHEEMRKKDEMRKRYQIELSTHKQQIVKLESSVHMLETQLENAKQIKIVKQTKQESHDLNQSRNRRKEEQLRQDELKQLQQIIVTKDHEIQELQNKLQLLKKHQAVELELKENQLQSEKSQHSAVLEEKCNAISRLQAEITKMKEVIAKGEEEQKLKISAILTQKNIELEKLNEENGSGRAEKQKQITSLKNDIRKLTFEVAAITREVNLKQQQIQLLHEQHQKTHIVHSNKEKEMLESFYLSQIKLKEEEISDLRERNAELTNDIFDARQNYASLEKKLENLIESQGSLREIEQKVINLGKQNNLVKNKKAVLG